MEDTDIMKTSTPNISDMKIKKDCELTEEDLKRIEENNKYIINKKIIIEDEDGNITLKLIVNEGVLVGIMHGRDDLTFTINEELINTNEELKNKYVTSPISD